MKNIFMINLNRLHLISKHFLNPLLLLPLPPLSHSLHTASFSLHKQNPINWNTNHTFVLRNPLLSLLEKCKSFSQFKQIQAQMILTSLISNGLASSRLIAFSAISESRNLDYCTKLLQTLTHPNTFSYNVAIRGYLESENPKEAIFLYNQMLRNSVYKPDNYTYPILFKVCDILRLNCVGNVIRVHVLRLGLDLDIYVKNALIRMLVSCGDLKDAHKVFDESSVRDLVSWTCLINGYVRSNRPSEALRVYKEMETEGVKPDEVTMIGVVSCCGRLEDLTLGRRYHRYIEENGLKMNASLANAIIDMYLKCRDLDAARRVLDGMDTRIRTIVSWTTMLVGYVNFDSCLDRAIMLFHDMPEKDVVSWNAMIRGYVKAKRWNDALTLLFCGMLRSNTKPDEMTMVSCLTACSQLGALHVGVWIHRYIDKHNLNLNVVLGTALLDMYVKCGDITNAIHVFRNMRERNALTWTVIIRGLALHGNAHDAISYFTTMTDSGFVPDGVTFLGVLSACCHGGLVEEGREYFTRMTSEFNICPRQEHYACMVDLLGRAGRLEEAERVLESMPMGADGSAWGALFSGCRTHGNVVLAEKVGLKLLELDRNDSGVYVLLSNVYGEANMWEDVRRVRSMMRDKGVEKAPGCSSIKVHDGLVLG